jgi:ABC-type microcin C transport system permease subunit YejE
METILSGLPFWYMAMIVIAVAFLPGVLLIFLIDLIHGALEARRMRRTRVTLIKGFRPLPYDRQPIKFDEFN